MGPAAADARSPFDALGVCEAPDMPDAPDAPNAIDALDVFNVNAFNAFETLETLEKLDTFKEFNAFKAFSAGRVHFIAKPLMSVVQDGLTENTETAGWPIG